jgi:hypothetical protein
MPERSLEVLSRQEVARLRDTGAGSLHELLRRCALAVLNWGSETDSAREVLDEYADFDLRIVQQDHGVTLALQNAPSSAFVDGQMIRGIRELLFAVFLLITNYLLASLRPTLPAKISRIWSSTFCVMPVCCTMVPTPTWQFAGVAIRLDVANTSTPRK